MSYHTSADEAVRNAATLVRAGAQAIKLEGGRKRLPVIEAIVDAEIPVMGHLGLTPQSVHAMGGFKVQGREHDAALRAASTTPRRSPPPGASPSCSRACPTRSPAWSPTRSTCPRSASAPAVTPTARCSCTTTCWASRTAWRPSSSAATPTLGEAAVEGLKAYADDVRGRRFPSDAESYHLSAEVAESLSLYGGPVRS